MEHGLRGGRRGLRLAGFHSKFWTLLSFEGTGRAMRRKSSLRKPAYSCGHTPMVHRSVEQGKEG